MCVMIIVSVTTVLEPAYSKQSHIPDYKPLRCWLFCVYLSEYYISATHQQSREWSIIRNTAGDHMWGSEWV